MPIDEVSKSMVVRRHQELAKVPSTANHTLRRFRSIWNHTRRTYDLPESPTLAIQWFEERPDGRIIEDLGLWQKTIDELYNPIHKVLFELLLFTGLRKTEALTLQWTNIHEDYIHIQMTKNGRSFNLPITPIHHEILEPLNDLRRKWVFPSPKSKVGYITNPDTP